MRWKQIIILCLLSMVCLTWKMPAQVWAATSGTVDVQPDASDQDAEEVNGSTNITSMELDLGEEGGQFVKVGIRFKNITIPPGSTITNAYIKFTCRISTSSNTDLEIWGHADDSPTVFSAALNPNNNISLRTKTSSSVVWGTVPQWTAEVEYQTPDISAVVQEIVNRGYGGNPGNWASGNHMVFIVEGTGARSAHSYNGNPAAAPLLHIEYTSGVVEVYPAHSNDDAEENSSGGMYRNSSDLELVNESTDQTIGIRFPNVTVPQGAVITNAYLEFTVDETPTGTTNLTIKGEAGDNAARFAGGNNDITNRTTTGASVAWNDIPVWDTAGVAKQSPSISAVIQEIVGRAGWSSGNALAVIITGSGERTVESYNGAAGHGDLTMAPMLHIEYSLDPVPYISTDSTALGASCYEGDDATAATFPITTTGSASMS